MFQVVKRDGEIAEFRLDKIAEAVKKAFDATENEYSSDMLDLLALRVTSDFQKKIVKGKVSVEDIQDSVENVLIQAGYSDVAKSYILYRKQREKIPQYEVYNPGLQRDRKQLCESGRLEGKGKLHSDLLCGRPDPE